MSAGSAAGSKVRRAKLTGCLLNVMAGCSLAGWLQESTQQQAQPMNSASSKKEGAMNRREGNGASALDFAGRQRSEANDMPRRVAGKALQLLKGVLASSVELFVRMSVQKLIEAQAVFCAHLDKFHAHTLTGFYVVNGSSGAHR